MDKNIKTEVEHASTNNSSTWSLIAVNAVRDREEALLLDEHLTLLRKLPSQEALPEMMTTPIFVMAVLRYAEDTSASRRPKAISSIWSVRRAV